MIRKLTLALAVSSIALSGSAMAQSKPAPVADLVKQVNIPYQKFTLPNGLTVLVHEDRKAPIVAVSIWYGVGSKHEPKGQTGFAHLFEHIMFNGSENAPGDYFQYTKKIGATDLNGTTWLDRTNYFQTVPTSALESALFLESDRMGHLENGITEESVKNQIGVVSNEKRQGDNQPYGLVEYAQSENLFPKGHPYHHSTIGSLEDLAAAKLDDFKKWFKNYYGPNNSVLVLAGDIDAAQARPLVEKWFGDIPRGPEVAPVNAPIPTLDAPKKIVLKDKIPSTRIYRHWIVPGLADPEFTALRAGASVLGGLASSRLDNVLVREEQSAVGVTAFVLPFVHGSLFWVHADVKPGGDADALGKRLDELMADFIKNGPTADEVQRVASSEAAARIDGLEQIGGFGGKAVALAEGQLYTGDPEYYKKELERLAALKPATIAAAMQKWLTRPVLEIVVEPGEREAYQEVPAGSGGIKTGGLSAPAFYIPPGSDLDTGITAFQGGDRSKMPDPGVTPNVDFPTVEEGTLKNGIKVFFAKRNAVPSVRVAVSFDAGYAADPVDKRGMASMLNTLLSEGTTTLTATQLAETEERLGADVNVNSSQDRTIASVRAVKPNLAASLALLADVVKNPALAEKDIERVRVQQLTRIAGENAQPQGIASRKLPGIIYGKNHPYGGPQSGSGDLAAIQSLTKAELAAFHAAWLHPQKAEIFVVGDTSLKEITALLNKEFGNWKPKAKAAPAKAFTSPIPEQKGRIILVDRPNSPQSMILGGQVLNAKGSDDLVTFRAANDVFGGDFTARLNMDLRETKGWSYGSYSQIPGRADRIPFGISAPVQTNQTGPSLAAILGHLKDVTGDKGVTPEERDLTVNGNILELPGSYEQSGAVMGQMQADRLYKRPFTYVETLADRYRKLTPAEMDAAFKAKVDPGKFTWLVVGDAAKVKSQLEALGLPIEMAAEDATTVAANTNVTNATCPTKERNADMAAVDGDWDVTIKSPMGDQKSVFTVNSDGSSFTGKVAGALGSMDVKDGTVDGNTLTWKMDMTVPMPMTLEGSATVDGDNISGEVKAGAFGSMAMSGCRKA
jgi:predicted Zn-dependent peptidase